MGAQNPSNASEEGEAKRSLVHDQAINMPKNVSAPSVSFEDSVFEVVSKKNSAPKMSYIEKLKQDVAVEKARLKGKFVECFG